jgi:hypothetical protein
VIGNEVMTGIQGADFQPAAECYGRLLGRAPEFVAIEGREVLWQVRERRGAKLRGGCLSSEI